MARQIKTIDYDAANDIFSISDGEKVKASIDVGDFILDVSHDNLICGMEIMDASENLGATRELLGSIRKMKMSITYKTNHIYVLLMISSQQSGKEINVQIPLSISLGHQKPKKEVLTFN